MIVSASSYGQTLDTKIIEYDNPNYISNHLYGISPMWVTLHILLECKYRNVIFAIIYINFVFLKLEKYN